MHCETKEGGRKTGEYTVVLPENKRWPSYTSQGRLKVRVRRNISHEQPVHAGKGNME